MLYEIRFHEYHFNLEIKTDSNFQAEMIQQENYPLEIHTVRTEDGYILTLYRIPGPPGSIPVFLQHGLLESSTDWLIPGKGKSLGK